MKKLFILMFTLIIAGSSSKSFAQGGGDGSDYYTSAGLKFYPGSFTLKHFIADQSALEGLIFFWERGTRITGLYEFHEEIPGVPGMKWYAGLGAHLSFLKSSFGTFSPGPDGVVGLDYKLPTAPINLALDWQPSIELGDYTGSKFIGNWGGLSIRYTFR